MFKTGSLEFHSYGENTNFTPEPLNKNSSALVKLDNSC